MLRFAEGEHIDLIVIGSHGRAGLFKLLMGSVAASVARNAKCPVLATMQPANVLENARDLILLDA